MRPIFAAKFDPFDSRKFATAGYDHVAFWKSSGPRLSARNYIRPSETEIFVCMEYLKIPMGVSWKTDLLLGSDLGHLSMVVGGKLLRCR